MQTIPIVFATNEDYVSYLGVALQSLVEHASEEKVYEITILYSKLKQYSIKRLEKVGRKHFNIRCMDVSDRIKGINFRCSRKRNARHMSKETYYRILIPELLEQYDKVLYLDCDLVVLRDIADLYETDIGNCIFGAAYSSVFWITESKGFVGEQIEEGFNAGVLIINTRAFLKDKMKERCVELIDSGKEFTLNDQDLLREVSKGRIYYIDNRWNIPWHNMQEGEGYLEGVSLNAYQKALEAPYLLHFTSPTKPWNRPDGPLADYFWEYARKTVFYEEIIYKNTSTLSGNADDSFDDYLFPFDAVKRGSRIILYGAGNVGNVFKRQVQKTAYCHCVAWTDKRYQDLQAMGQEICSPDDIGKMDFDSIVLAVERENVAETIKTELEEKGIKRESMIWRNPIK